MIRNDAELQTMRERVAALEQLIVRLRSTARPEEWAALSSGYRFEVERMQGEILTTWLKAPCRRSRADRAACIAWSTRLPAA
jgi:hypothetical protein